MFISTYPLAANGEPQWINFDQLSYKERRKSNLSFLYIGSYSEVLHYFSSFFSSGVFARDFSEGKQLLRKQLAGKEIVPDAIIIDVSLDVNGLREFCQYIRATSEFLCTILIYNESRLLPKEINCLSKEQLVDDIVNINSWETNFSMKVDFLKKFRNQAQKLKMSDCVFSMGQQRHKKLPLLKRAFDVAGSLTLIILCLPVFLFISLAIKLGSKGPVIFTSSRAGQGFRVFKFYKFRTMEVDAEQKIASLSHLNQYTDSEKGVKFLKICNDPRVTKFGRFLRKTSLDELPQLFNVLKGDMSLVGNRPLPLYEASTLTTDEFAERFMAPAGITGLWQVKKRGKAEMSAKERIDLDIQYARQFNFKMDLYIMAQTPFVIFQKSNV